MCAQVMMYPCCRIWRKAGVVVRYVHCVRAWASVGLPMLWCRVSRKEVDGMLFADVLFN